MPFCAGAATVTFESLLDEMTNLEILSRQPDPAFTCKQFASYDPASTDPAVQTDENWYANHDRGHMIRTETRNGEEEHVLMDAKGPGAIVRIWSANPFDAGTVRVYIDGEKDPTIEMELTEMLGGGKAPFIKPISIELARGWNSYLPIPYAKHCKITTSKKDYYYHVNYRTYEKGTKVKSYRPADAEKLSEKIEAIAKHLENPKESVVIPQAALDNTDLSGNIDLRPGDSQELPLYGAMAIYSVEARVSADEVEDALRKVMLEITFDGHGTPDVQTPLGDFFGTAPGPNVYAGLPCGVTKEGRMYSHWVMPFKESAVVRLTNHSSQTVSISGTIAAAPRAWTDDSLYFRAKWRGVRDIPTLPRQDFNFLDATGKGRFVGCHMHITNPVADWWGEGDEKIYVDGEKFPSHFGTGTEDYFGYAWCSPEVYVQAYHSQPRCDGPGNYGHSSNNRFHILDNIPFTTAFKFDMEVWHWKECNIAQSVVVYYYATPETTDTFTAPKPEDLEMPTVPEMVGVKGALEGERRYIHAITGGETEKQTGFGTLWSLSAQLWWKNAKPGDKLDFDFPVKKAGRYEVVGNFTTANDYGIAKFSINGAPATEPIDFYRAGDVGVTGEISLGTYDLPEGKSRMIIEITGSNPEAYASHMIGLDYLLLKPVP